MESISEEKKTAKTVFVFTANRDEDEIKLVETFKILSFVAK